MPCDATTTQIWCLQLQANSMLVMQAVASVASAPGLPLEQCEACLVRRLGVSVGCPARCFQRKCCAKCCGIVAALSLLLN